MHISKYINSSEIKNILVSKKGIVARVNDGFWKDTSVGDYITFIDGKTSVDVVVTKTSHVKDFGDAWFIHDKELFTDNNFVSREEANKHFSRQYEYSDVLNNGVAVVEFSLV